MGGAGLCDSIWAVDKSPPACGHRGTPLFNPSPLRGAPLRAGEQLAVT